MISNFEKIKEKSTELDNVIENGENIEIIFKKSIEIDQLIVENQRCK